MLMSLMGECQLRKHTQHAFDCSGSATLLLLVSPEKATQMSRKLNNKVTKTKNKTKPKKMAGHSDVFPVKSKNTICEHYLLDMLQFMQLEIQPFLTVKQQLFFLKIVSSNTLIRRQLIHHILLKSAKKRIITVFNGQTTYFLLKNGLKQ